MFLRAFFRISIFLLLLEIFLRSGGGIYILHQEFLNQHVSLLGLKKYRIVCVGDSMTAYGENDSYPRQLEGILNGQNLGYHFEVINKGLPAQNSDTIMPHFSSWMDQYKPDMVIMMMGMNDQNLKGDIFDKKAMPLDDLLSRSLVYRLFKKQIETISLRLNKAKAVVHKASTPPEEPKNYDPRVILYFKIAEQLNRHGQYSQAEAILSRLQAVDVEETNKNFIAIELGKSLMAQHKTGALVGPFTQLMRFDPYNALVAEWGKELCGQKGLASSVGDIIETIDTDQRGIPQLDVLLGDCYTTRGDLKKAGLYRRLSRSRGVRQSYPVLYHNYNIYIDKLNARQIKAVIAQYPLKDLNTLKEIFKDRPDYSDLLFVDNGPTFKEAVARSSYEDIFGDKAGGDFGHCTPKGYKLLAGNVAAVIADHLRGALHRY